MPSRTWTLRRGSLTRLDVSARWTARASLLGVLGCGPPAHPPAVAPSRIDVRNQILARNVEGTADELRARGERALLVQDWQGAVAAYEALLAGEPAALNDARVLYDLAAAHEGLRDEAKARSWYRELTRRVPDDPRARSARVREASIDAHLEDWAALGELGGAILERRDNDPADVMLGLGARSLARLEARDEQGAARDIHRGLDLVEEHRFGATGQLPVAAAMLKYALGELKRARSESVVLDPPGTDFVARLEARCQLLLEAQSAYADAIRAVDPHWAAMSGFRVGEMYRTLHGALMKIPPTPLAKTERDRQVFYGIMHVRYRVLLEKGLEMMERTLALGEKTGAGPSWMSRAEAAKVDMRAALADERATLAAFPFTEAELERALVLLKKRADSRRPTP